MTWRDRQLFFPEGANGDLQLEHQYERARFKDAPFWVESYNIDGGRRQALQRIAGAQYTNVADLGADSMVLGINAFLIGDNYDSELRWLEGRLLEGGEGELVLPWREPFMVTVVGRIRVDETKGQRGYATITFSCVETSAPPASFQRDSAARMRAASSNARSVTRERFADRFDVRNQPELFRESIRTTMADGAKALTAIQGYVSAFIGQLPALANSFNQLVGSFNALINTPLQLSDEVVNAVVTAYSALRSTSQTAQAVAETWGRGGPVRILADTTFNFNGSYAVVTVDTSGTFGSREQQNLNEWNRLLRLSCFYEMAQLLPDMAFESRDQAVGIRSRFVDELDTLLLDATGKEYEALSDLSQSTGEFLEEVAGTLPRLATYTPALSLPAYVVAHIIYGDARRATDIVLRNSIRHPGFVESGVPLEVLSA